MRESVDEGHGAGGVREDGGPLFEREIGGQCDGLVSLVAAGDDLEE